MKLLLPLSLLCLSCLSAKAQAEFAPIGARWFQNAAIENIWDTHPLQDFYVIESEKDTLVDGLLHRKVGDYLFYQDGAKVYYRWQDSLRLVYDYGVAVGDTVRFELLYGFSTVEEDMEPVQNTYIVDDVSFVQFNTVSLKQVECKLLEGYECPNPEFPDSLAFSYSYLERIGSVRGVLESIKTCATVIPGAVAEWLRCYQDDEISYQTERFLMTAEEGEGCDYRMPNAAGEVQAGVEVSVFPNPVRSGQSVYLRRAAQGEAATRLHLFNQLGARVATIRLQGLVQERVVLPQLPAGMYWVSLEHQKGRFRSMLPLIVAD